MPMAAAAAAAPRPKSPPASPDPCGRHRLQLAVDALHREIGFLEGEINSVEGVHAASKCCKEVDEFIGRNTDPFISISSEKPDTDQSHYFLKKFRATACLSYLSWICCCCCGGGGGCSASASSSAQLKRPPLSALCSCGAAAAALHVQRLCRLCSTGSCRRRVRRACCCCCTCGDGGGGAWWCPRCCCCCSCGCGRFSCCGACPATSSRCSATAACCCRRPCPCV